MKEQIKAYMILISMVLYPKNFFKSEYTLRGLGMHTEIETSNFC